jgi:WD40-like Beta Propeller Repeat
LSVLTPPKPPRSDGLELLIREARARQRRRRFGAAASLAVLAATALVAWGIDRAVVVGASARSLLTPVVDARAFAGHGNLAFVSRNRLWLLDGGDGRLVRIARPRARSPVFSPNGRWLAWSQGAGRFGIARSDGTGARLHASGGNAPRWLPDGRLLVGRAVYRMAGGVPVPAGKAPEGLVSWTPDGSRYAFVEVRLSRHRPGSYDEVERVEISTSLAGPRKVWYEAPGSFTTRDGFRGDGISDVAILPAGGILVWLDPMHSASIAADGLPVYEIGSPRARPRKLGVTIGSPVTVGKDGRFALGAGGDRIAWTTKRVVTCAAGRCRPLRTPTGQMTLDPAWSPGGRRLAYVTGADLGVDVSTFPRTLRRWYRTRRLWIGGRPIPESVGAASPVWSADGRSVLFVARDGLWLLPRPAARPVRIAAPLFSPRGWPSYYGQVDWTGQFAWWSRG